MITIILAHPWHGSFNKAILDTLIEKYKNERKEYQIIDLYKDNFRASYTEEELSHYNKGYTNDKTVLKYQEMIRNTSEIVLIFPIWWGTMPAILKGFFDRVMLLDFAFNYQNGWTPLLNINKGTVITTSQSPTDFFKQTIEHGVIQQMLGSVGVNNVKWYNCDNVSHSPREDKTKFLEMLKKEEI